MSSAVLTADRSSSAVAAAPGAAAGEAAQAAAGVLPRLAGAELNESAQPRSRWLCSAE